MGVSGGRAKRESIDKNVTVGTDVPTMLENTAEKLAISESPGY